MNGSPNVTLTPNFLRTRRIGLSIDLVIGTVLDSIVDSIVDTMVD